MKRQTTLAELRTQIIKVTKEIIELAGKRNELACEIGRIKTKDFLPIEDEGVEDELVRQVISECERVGLDRSVGLKILNTLIADSKRTQGIRGRDAPASTFSKALELQRKGIKLLRLDVGEPDFPPPAAVVQACADALFSHKTHYTESQGIPQLRDALRRYLARKHRFEAGEEEVVVTPSGRFAVYAALATVVGEGEGAIVVEPNWPAYRDALRQLGAKCIPVRTSIEEGWTPSTRQVEESIRPNTKAMVLSYPNNPTGRVISANLFKELVGLADDTGLTVISDEIYNEYAFGPCPSTLETTPKKFIVTSSFSKTWAMTGFRIGYAVSSKEIVASISKMISLMFTSVPEFIQWGAIKALEADDDVRRNVAGMRTRIDVVCRELDRINSLEYRRPDGAMYVFPRLKNQEESGDSFSQKLLAKGVSVVPGSIFGDYRDSFRISLGQQEETIVEGVKRIGEALA